MIATIFAQVTEGEHADSVSVMSSPRCWRSLRLQSDCWGCRDRIEMCPFLRNAELESLHLKFGFSRRVSRSQLDCADNPERIPI